MAKARKATTPTTGTKNAAQTPTPASPPPSPNGDNGRSQPASALVTIEPGFEMWPGTWLRLPPATNPDDVRPTLCLKGTVLKWEPQGDGTIIVRCEATTPHSRAIADAMHAMTLLPGRLGAAVLHTWCYVTARTYQAECESQGVLGHRLDEARQTAQSELSTATAALQAVDSLADAVRPLAEAQGLGGLRYTMDFARDVRAVSAYISGTWNPLNAGDSGRLESMLARLDYHAEEVDLFLAKARNGDWEKAVGLPPGDGSEQRETEETAVPALTPNMTQVLQTMARFDASRLLSSKMIAEEMDAKVRLSEETVRLCVGKLIESNLAERPEGDRSGARLNSTGRKLAGRIAD